MPDRMTIREAERRIAEFMGFEVRRPAAGMDDPDCLYTFGSRLYRVERDNEGHAIPIHWPPSTDANLWFGNDGIVSRIVAHSEALWYAWLHALAASHRPPLAVVEMGTEYWVSFVGVVVMVSDGPDAWALGLGEALKEASDD